MVLNFLSANLKCQNIKEDYGLTFISGLTFYRLTSEGIYCRSIKNNKKRAFFWDIDQLNTKRVVMLKEFVKHYLDSVSLLKKTPIVDGFGGTQITIQLLNSEGCISKEIKYFNCYNKELNYIIEMINKTIPRRSRRLINLLQFKMNKGDFLECKWK